MKDKPILFSTPMVQAIMNRRKTQTRRILNNKVIQQWEYAGYPKNLWIESCPYQVGQKLWVRETWNDNWGDNIIYKADGGSAIEAGYSAEPKWKPSIFMPKNYARIWLEVTGVRIERLQDITEEDAICEGIIKHDMGGCERLGKIMYAHKNGIHSEWELTAVQSFINLWDALNKKRGYGWDINPYVWVVEFKLLEK